MLIGDNLAYRPRHDYPDPGLATPEELRKSFVPTMETGEVCSRLLQRLAGLPAPHSKAFLLTGRSGVGKTHVLRYLACLLESPLDPAWNVLNNHLAEVSRPKRPVHSLFLRVPADPKVDLGRHLASAITDTATMSTGSAEMPFEEFAAGVQRAASALAETGTLLVILEDVSRRLDRVTGEQALLREKQIYRTLIASLTRAGVLPVLVGEERHLKRERGSRQRATPLAELSRSCDFIWISRGNITEIVASVLLIKDARQKDAVRRILGQLRKRLPSFGPDLESFVDLYPIHPAVFDALFQLRMFLPAFSPLRFIQEAVPRVLGSPEERLVTLDILFDAILPDLQKVERLNPLLASFETLRAHVLPSFNAGIQARIEALLKAITFSTICEARPADVKSLANSLLLCEESELLPSYSLTAALLMEMEHKSGAHLLAEGEKLERGYRLLDFAPPTTAPGSRVRPGSAEEFYRRFPLLIYDWIGSEIPVWKPDFGTKYERGSQSLVAPLPEGQMRTKGLVFFKSEQDPFWSKEDFQALETGRYAWILVILSSLEDLCESDSRLRELASRSERILIWRPGKLSAEDTGHLRELIAGGLTTGSAGIELSTKVRDESRRILRSLYVQKGQFMTSSDQWPVGEEIETRTLSLYLSLHLSALASPGPASSKEEQAPTMTVSEDLSVALRVASLLAGLEAHGSDTPESVRNRLMEWWDNVCETDKAMFSTKARPLPDSLMTAHFWREVRHARNHLERLRPLFEPLRDEGTRLRDAMAEVLRLFGGDENKIRQWAGSLRNLATMTRWLPTFERTRDYVLGAFPLGLTNLDEKRDSLLSSISQPHRFIEPSERERYDREFLEFKKGYIKYYQSAHEEVLNIVSASQEAERKVDAKALQNLELLSDLLYTDKSYINRVRILGRWILLNQCLLPVTKILERYPRCYCNFNPAGNRELAESAGQINGLIQEGIEYFRSALRNCNLMIVEDLKALKVDELHSKQIAVLLSRSTLEPLKPKTIAILNKIIERHSNDFLIVLRS